MGAVTDTPKLPRSCLTQERLRSKCLLGRCGGDGTAGGWLNGRRVAETMSKKIVPLDHEQGLVANLVTSGLVLTASSLGLPVSTTHVSVGSVSGTGLVTGKLDLAMQGWASSNPRASFRPASPLLLMRVGFE
jgi:PiT family inorganic phosphate transporter